MGIFRVRRRSRRKIKTIILFVLLIFFSLLMMYSFYRIVSWWIDNMNTNNEIRNVQDKAKRSEAGDGSLTEVYGNSKYHNEKLLRVDFSKLQEVNNEVVGWIKVLGTNIDYPFVQHSDNSYYLKHSFNKKYNDAGWVFLDYRNNIDELDKNTIIYAHGRVDGTMFGSLKSTLRQEWFSNDSNFLVKISTPNNNYLYEVFSIYHIKTTDDYLNINFGNSSQFNSFIHLIRGRSVYNFNTEVLENDKIITLSTCYNNNEKMVLHAKLIKREIRK